MAQEVGMSFVNGFLFGEGFVSAATVLKVLFHWSLCG